MISVSVNNCQDWNWNIVYDKEFARHGRIALGTQNENRGNRPPSFFRRDTFVPSSFAVTRRHHAHPPTNPHPTHRHNKMNITTNRTMTRENALFTCPVHSAFNLIDVLSKFSFKRTELRCLNEETEGSGVFCEWVGQHFPLTVFCFFWTQRFLISFRSSHTQSGRAKDYLCELTINLFVRSSEMLNCATTCWNVVAITVTNDSYLLFRNL